MKVECIDDSDRDDHTTWINFGDIYTVVDTYVAPYRWFDGEIHTMYVLAEVKRGCQFWGDGWSYKRFKPLKRTSTKIETKEAEPV